MSKQLSILNIGGHPKDCILYAGGTVARHVARGDHVTMLTPYTGLSHHLTAIDAYRESGTMPDMDGLIEERRQEIVNASAVLGVTDVRFLGYDDSITTIDPNIVSDIADVIGDIQPDIIITHFPKEGDGLTNPHAIAGQIVTRAIGLAASVDPGDQTPPHRTAQVFYFGIGAAKIPRDVWDSQGGFYNDVFIDITDVIDKKLASLDFLVSQGYGGAYARKRIETSDGAFGMAGQCAYAEGFIRANSETHYHLPLTDHAMTVARSSDHENISRNSFRIKTD